MVRPLSSYFSIAGLKPLKELFRSVTPDAEQAVYVLWERLSDLETRFITASKELLSVVQRSSTESKFVCPICKRESWNLEDRRHGWCVACQKFTRRTQMFITGRSESGQLIDKLKEVIELEKELTSSYVEYYHLLDLSHVGNYKIFIEKSAERLSLVEEISSVLSLLLLSEPGIDLSTLSVLRDKLRTYIGSLE